MKYCLLLSFSITTFAFAQDYKLEDIILSSKLNTPKNEALLTVEEISKHDLNRSVSTLNALKDINGIDVIQNGSNSGVSSISIRGSSSRHVLVLVNGIRISDRAGIGSFDAKLISSSDVERIEVLKGAQALLYGSDALGGVINIITKKGTDKSSLSFTTGDIHGVKLENNYSKSNLNIYLNGYYEESSMQSASSSGSEDDGYTQRGINTNIYYSISKDLSVEFVAKLDRTITQLDSINSSSEVVDSKAKQIKESGLYSNTLKYKNKNTVYKCISSFSKTSRKEIDDRQSLFDGDENSHQFSILTSLKNKKLLMGIDFIKEGFEGDGEKRVTNERISYSGLLSQILSSWAFDIGTRYTKDLIIGENISSSVNTSYTQNHHKYEFSVGQGYKIPSLYQLKGTYLGSLVGNPDLDAEKALTLNFSYLYKELTLSTFYTKYRDLIDFDSSYINRNSFETHGIEGSYNILDFNFGVELLSHNAFGEDVLRRPSQIYRLSYNYKDIKLSARHRGETQDSKGTETKSLRAFTTIDLAYSHNAYGLNWIMSASNIFSDAAVTAYGYNGSPRIIKVSGKLYY